MGDRGLILNAFIGLYLLVRQVAHLSVSVCWLKLCLSNQLVKAGGGCMPQEARKAIRLLSAVRYS